MVDYSAVKRNARAGFIIVCSALCWLAAAPLEAQGEDWASDYQSIVELLDDGETAHAWDMIWKWASQQHKDALFAVAGGILEGVLEIPGAPSDGLADLRFALIFAAYSMDGDVYRRQLVLDLSEFLDPGPTAGSPFINCLRSDSSDQECIIVASQYDIIPDFHLFREEIENYTQENL